MNEATRLRLASRMAAAVLLVGLALAPVATATGGAVTDLLEDPPIQHTVCPTDTGVADLVAWRRFSEEDRETNWWRLYQDHVTGEVYASWELADGWEFDLLGIGVDDEGPVRIHQLETTDGTGYCVPVDATVPEFHYSVDAYLVEMDGDCVFCVSVHHSQGRAALACADTYVDRPRCVHPQRSAGALLCDLDPHCDVTAHLAETSD